MCQMDKKNLHTELWQQLEQDDMTDAERIAFLEQFVEDEDAVKKLTSLELIPMPAYLEEEVLETILSQEVYRPPKWLQLFSYSMKITFAAACAIAALFWMPDISIVNQEQMALERMMEMQAREEAAAKRQQKILNEQEKRHQTGAVKSSYIAEALQFISEKIFVEE